VPAALVLLLTLLGHDIAMAGDSHRVDRPHQAVATRTDGHLLSPLAPPDAAETACGVGRDGALASVPERPTGPLVGAKTKPHIASRFVPLAGTRPDVLPHRTPASRALLQVWLI
jgi:hypothetical protein